MRDKELLSLMFADAEEFRVELLERTLRTIRLRRRIRRAAQVVGVLGVFAVALWWNAPRRAVVNRPVETALEVIHTRPLSRDQIVTTSPSSVVLISSEELLGLVPGKTNLLVWHAPGHAELIVLDSSGP